MKRPERQSDGKYHIGGKIYPELFGSRRQVWNRTAYKTSGLLKREDLVMNKHRRIVSASKYKSAKSENRLLKYGYGTQKNKFGAVRLKGTKRVAKNGKSGGLFW